MARPFIVMKCVVSGVNQVGNLTTMVDWWGPPEAMTEANMPRPAYIVRTEQGTPSFPLFRFPCRPLFHTLFFSLF